MKLQELLEQYEITNNFTVHDLYLDEDGDLWLMDPLQETNLNLGREENNGNVIIAEEWAESPEDAILMEYPGAEFTEDDKHRRIDLRTGLGVELYPKADFTMLEIANDILFGIWPSNQTTKEKEMKIQELLEELGLRVEFTRHDLKLDSEGDLWLYDPHQKSNINLCRDTGKGHVVVYESWAESPEEAIKMEYPSAEFTEDYLDKMVDLSIGIGISYYPRYEWAWLEIANDILFGE